MDHEVSVQGVAGRSRGACARPAQTDLRGAGGADHSGSGIARSHPHVGGGAAATGARQARAVPEGAIVADAARRLSAPAETLLGPTPVGPWVLLRDGGRGR